MVKFSQIKNKMTPSVPFCKNFGPFCLTFGEKSRGYSSGQNSGVFCTFSKLKGGILYIPLGHLQCICTLDPYDLLRAVNQISLQLS